MRIGNLWRCRSLGEPAGAGPASPTAAAAAAAPASAPAPPRPSPHEAQADFLGFSGGRSPLGKAHQAAPDFMGLDDSHGGDTFPTAQPPAPAHVANPPRQQQPPKRPAHADDLDIFASPKVAAAAAAAARDPTDIFNTSAQPAQPRAGVAAAAGGELMMDFGEDGAAEAAVFSAAGDVDVEGEPELRKVLW